MPRLVFEQSAIQAPIVRVPRDTLGGVSAPGQGFQDLSQSLFRLGQAQDQLNQVADTRAKQIAGYNDYLEYATGLGTELAQLELSTPDAMTRLRLGQDLIKSRQEQYMERAAEGGYSLEFLKHAGPHTISTLNKFLSKTGGEVRTQDIAMLETNASATVEKVVDSFTGFIGEIDDSNIRDASVTFDEASLQQVGVEMGAFAQFSMDLPTVGPEVAEPIIEKATREAATRIIRKAAMTAKLPFLMADDLQSISIEVPFTDALGNSTTRKYTIDEKEITSIRGEVATLLSQRNTQQSHEQKQANNLATERSNESVNTLDRMMFLDGVGIDTVRHQALGMLKAGLLTPTAHSKFLLDSEAFFDRAAKRQDPGTVSAYLDRINNGNFDPSSSIRIPTSAEIAYDSHLTVDTKRSLNSLLNERMARIESEYNTHVKRNANFIANFITESIDNRSGLSKTEMDRIGLLASEDYWTRMDSMPIEQRTAVNAKIAAMQSIKDVLSIVGTDSFFFEDNLKEYYRKHGGVHRVMPEQIHADYATGEFGFGDEGIRRAVQAEYYWHLSNPDQVVPIEPEKPGEPIRFKRGLEAPIQIPKLAENQRRIETLRQQSGVISDLARQRIEKIRQDAEKAQQGQ